MELIENLQYGNEAGMSYHYSYAALLVEVPSFTKRTTTKGKKTRKGKGRVKD
jgi:hypothetical protein